MRKPSSTSGVAKSVSKTTVLKPWELKLRPELQTQARAKRRALGPQALEKERELVEERVQGILAGTFPSIFQALQFEPTNSAPGYSQETMNTVWPHAVT